VKRKGSKNPDLWAIILAGGESKRMNAPKMLLPFHGKTIIEKTIGNVIESDVENTLVVLGGFRDEISSLIKYLPVLTCYNENYKEGMLSSVKCGFRNLPENYEAVLVMQGDQPMICSEIINEVITGFRKSGKGIVMPVYNKKRGHPLLIDKKYSEDVVRLDSENGLRALSEQFSEDVLEVEVNKPEILRDIDTHEDYLREINQTK
jgi:molybdenum cofactor cytidylyltransferase